MISPRAKKILRRIAYGLLGTILVLLNVVAAALIYLSTDHARRTVVAFAVRKAQPVFPGGFEIGGSEGSLLRRLVLTDIVISDLDERPAVEVARTEVRFSLLPLLFFQVHVDAVRVDGLTVVSQPLADGRDNLATMAVIDKPLPPPPRFLPVSVRIDALDVGARFVALTAGMTMERPPADRDVHAVLHLAASVSHGMVLTLDNLLLSVTTPARATITASGGVHITKDPADMELRDVLVRVEGDTDQLRRRVDKLALSGPASIVARASGPMQDLVASLTADTTNPPISVRAAAHVYDDRARLETFKMTSPFAQVAADGTYKFDRTGDGSVHVDAPDLRPFALLGAPPMSGAVKLDGRGAHDAEHTSIKLTGAIDKLQIASQRIGHAALDVVVDDMVGKATIDAERLFLGAMDVRTVALRADASRERGQLTVSARGVEGVELDLAAEGVPRLAGNRLTALDATLARLHLRGGGTPWDLAAPAHVHADLERKAYSLDRLQLDSKDQHITMSGRVRGSTMQDVSLEVQRFDLAQLAGVLSPGHALPHSELTAKVDASGPFAQPKINYTFKGAVHGKGKRDLLHGTAISEGQLVGGRLNAKIFATIGGQKTSAKVDMPMPLRPAQPIDVSVDASVLLNPWFAELLVPRLIASQPIFMYSLGTTVLVQGSLTGTTSDPRVNFGARLRNWGAENGHGNLGMSAEYKDKKLSASGTLTFSALPLGGGAGAGVVQATAVLPVDLASVLTGQGGTFLDPAAEWHADLKLNHVGIERLPFAAFAVVPLTTRGWVDGSFELAGSQRHPKATAKVDARGLNMKGVSDIDLTGSAQLDGTVVAGELKAALHGVEAVVAKGSIGSEANRAGWERAPLAITFDAKGFDLGRLNVLKNLDGTLRGQVKLTGTVQRPSLEGEVKAASLRLGQVRYGQVSVKGAGNEYNGDLAVSATEEGGGKLMAKIAARGRRMVGSITAERFHFDVESELLPRLRELAAQVDGTVKVSGPTRAPQLEGTVELSQGQLRWSTTATTYRDGKATLELSGQRAQIKSFAVLAGNQGKVEGSGSIALRRLAVDRLALHATMHRFPLVWDTLTGVADATIAVEGARADGGDFETQVSLEKAFVELVDDRAIGGLHATRHLDDVKVQKAKPAPIADPIARDPKLTPRGGRQEIVIEGPLTARSNGMDFPARANLTLDFGAQTPLLTGELALQPRSTLKVFGNPYEVERGRFVFEHTAQPQLDLSLARVVGSDRIGVDLAGPMRQPTMRFWSKPASLGTPKIASLVTGQKASDRGLTMKGLEQKVDGPIAELIRVSLSQTAPDQPFARLDP